MWTTRWHAALKVELHDVPRPTPGPSDVVLDVVACGICGSDVHRYVEGAWATSGMSLGHEFSGIVSEVGDDVAGLAPGDRVAVNPAVPCGTCQMCRATTSNMCSSRVMAQGGLGEQVLVPRAVLGEQLFRMPDSMSFDEGAFVEPLSVAVRAIRQMSPDLDAPIGVLGLGTVGQCVLQALRAYGAQRLVGVDLSQPRREAASGAATAVLDPHKDLRSQLVALWGETRSPYQVAGPLGAAFECSGSASMLDFAIDMTRAGGGVSHLGLASARPQLDINAVVQKELRLHGSFAYTRDDAREAFRLLSLGLVDVSSLVSHRLRLSEVARAFELQRAASESIKVLVVPDRHFESAV